MEQTYNTILYRELCRSKQDDLSQCQTFWETSTVDPIKLYEEIIEKIQDFSFLQYLEKLSEQESKLIHILLQQQGTATSIQLLQKKNLSEGEINETSKSLQQKFLIYIRKCISQVKIVPYSHTIYSEPLKSLRDIDLLSPEDIINRGKNRQVQQKPPALSMNFRQLLHVNLDQYHYASIKKSPFHQEYLHLLSQDCFQHALLYDDSLKHLILTNGQKYSPDFSKYEPVNNKLFFLTRLYQIYYLIKTQGIFFTTKNELRKYDFNSLNQLFLQDQSLLESVIDFLQKAQFIQINNNQLQSDPSLITFLKASVNEKLKLILNSNPIVTNIFHIITRLTKTFFSLFDIAVELFKNQLSDQGYFSYDLFNDPDYNEQNLQQAIDFLCQIGLINITSQGYILSTIGQHYLKNSTIEEMELIQQAGVIVNNDHTVIVYPDQINDYHLFLIELFANRISDGMVLQYQFNKNTIQRGIYLGLTTDKFVNCLQLNSTQDIPDNIIFNINSWAKKLKKVMVKQVMVISGETDLLHTIQNEKKLEGKLEPIGNNYLLCNDKNLPDYIESEETIYFIKEGEDLTNGNH